MGELKVFISPRFGDTDKGEGGVRRTVEMQHRTFPGVGLDVVETPEEADVIVIHIMEQPHWLRRYPDTPIVADCHGLYWAEYDWPNWAIKANGQVMETIRMADGVIAHSEWVAQALKRHTLRDVYNVPHGVNLEEWQPTKNNAGYVVWNKNRPDPICNPLPVFELAKRLPDIKFITTFGRDDDESYPNVEVTGRVPYAEAMAMVKSAGIYLCTTRETFGIGTLEAMAAGIPIVGWNWGGQREFLTHKESAWLSTPLDHDALAEGIIWALGHRQQLARKAKAVVKQFDETVVAQAYAAALADIYTRFTHARTGPRTSIVVTAHNLEKYLPDTLDSVLEQTDKDWECIIVDDASPDRCGDIADIYAKENPDKFRVIHNMKNEYLAGARNTGIAEARGRFILPLDADDMITPETVQVLADSLTNERDIHVAYGSVLFVNEDGKTPTNYAGGYSPGHSGWPVEFNYDWQEQQRNCLPYAAMYRREVWELTCGYRTRCRTAEDADFWMRAASYGFRPKMVTDRDTLIYRNRNDSMSRQVGQREWAEWFPWYRAPHVRPAGAVTDLQSPIQSCDPPAINVVIPVGPGHERLLMDAIDSVDAQSLRQWECTVVNDTGHPLLNLPSWVRVIDTEGRVGVARARNMGIASGRAPLFLPLDADDYLQPTALQHMFEWADQTGDSIYSDWYDEYQDGRTEVYHAPDYDAALLTKNGAIHAVTALHPKAVWEAVGGYNETVSAWEDWDFQIALAAKGYCSQRIPLPLWNYRKDTGWRREENYAAFEASKSDIIERWNQYWEGGETLMACSSCQKKNIQAGAAIIAAAKPQAVNGDSSAVLIEYIGAAAGNRRFKAPTGTVYTFGLGQQSQRYVLEKDAEYFLGMTGQFKMLSALPTPEAGPAGAGPVLVAEGPPA